MKNIVKRFGFDYDMHSQCFLPIKKEQNLFSYCNAIAFSVHGDELRHTKKNVYLSHIVQNYILAKNILKPSKYKESGLCALLLHDVIEKSLETKTQQKYEIANPLSKTFDLNSKKTQESKNPTYINYLLQNKPENNWICWSLYLYTKRKNLNPNQYFKHFATNYQIENDFIAIQAITAVGKLCDMANNGDPNEEYRNNPKLLENKTRTGLDRLIRDIPDISEFILNKQIIDLNLYDIDKVKNLLDKTKNSFLSFFRENSLTDIFDILDKNGIEWKTTRSTKKEYGDFAHKLGFAAKRLVEHGNFFN